MNEAGLNNRHASLYNAKQCNSTTNYIIRNDYRSTTDHQRVLLQSPDANPVCLSDSSYVTVDVEMRSVMFGTVSAGGN